MNRFYIPSSCISSKEAKIQDIQQIHYIRDVLRFNEGDEVVIFTGSGDESRAVIQKISPLGIELRITGRKSRKSMKMHFTVACAIPKKSKFDDIVDKLTQLGVERIIPLKTERMIVRLDKEKADARLVRWQKIALSASQQSKRNILPVVDKITDIREVIADSGGFDLKLITTLIGKRKTIKQALGSAKFNNILVMIGPEGDFNGKETALAKRNGFIPVSLGEFVLRVETAALTAASIINFYEND